MPRELYVAAERKELFEQAQDDDELCDMLLQDAAELDDVHEACEMEEVAIWSLDDAHSRRIRALQPFDYGEAVRGKPKIVNMGQVREWPDWECKGDHRFMYDHIDYLMAKIEWPEDGYLRRGGHRFNCLESFLMLTQLLGTQGDQYDIGKKFGRRHNEVSAATNACAEWLVRKYDYALTNLSQFAYLA